MPNKICIQRQKFGPPIYVGLIVRETPDGYWIVVTPEGKRRRIHEANRRYDWTWERIEP